MEFARRSEKTELLDQKHIPFDAIRQNMQELEVINRYLGGHRISCKAVEKLAGRQKELHICEIGCGGGDNLKAIHKWAIKNEREVRFTGIDINPECIAYAKQNCKKLPATVWFSSDYRAVSFANDIPDIVFSSLFCHHLSESELPELVRWKDRNSRIGFFVNDLQRHPLAYYAIKMLTRFFSHSYLVKNDAPLSVLRGFRKKELAVFHNAQAQITIRWQWAFRWLLIGKHGANKEI